MSGSQYEQQAAIVTAPHMGAIAVIAVTDTSSSTDLADAAQLGELAHAGMFVTLIADDAVFFHMAEDDESTADGSATTGDDRCFLLPAGVEKHVLLRAGFTWFAAIAASATLVRAYVSSKPAQEMHRP